MSEIGPGRLMEAFAGPIDPESRRLVTATPETAFADLLRTFGTSAPSVSAEAFEANDLVGRAELLLVPGAPGTELRYHYEEPASLRPSHTARFQIDEVDVSPEAASSAVDIRAYEAGAHRYFVEDASATRPQSIDAVNAPALKSKPTPAAELPDVTVALRPMGRSASDQAQPASVLGILAKPAAEPNQPPQWSGSVIPPARPQPPRETSSSPAAKLAGNPILDKVRNLVFEHVQANASTVHVVLVAADSGLRIVARVGALQDAERTRLKESITAILAQHGFSDVDIVIRTSSPAGAGARQG